MRSAPLRLFLAAVAGVMAALAFPPVDWRYLLPVAVAVLVLLLEPSAAAPRRLASPALIGLVFGLGFMGGLVSWIRVIGVDVAVGLVVLQAAFYALAGWGVVRVRRLPGWPVWAAVVWTAAELLRSTVPWGGFPWGRLAFATIDTPLADAMALVGTSGVSFLVALLGTTLAWALLTARQRPAYAALVVPGVLLLTLVPGWLPWQRVDEKPVTVRVAAVQGNVPGEGMDPFSERRVVLDNHVRATHALADRVRAGETPRPDLVLWPENSTDIDPFADPTVRADIQEAVDDIGAPTLVGAMVAGKRPMDVENQGIVWLPGSGPSEHYSKRHPVPFGEYIPMRDQLAKYFARLDQIPRDMVRGTRSGALEIDGTTIGDVICFEVAYDGLVHDVVDDGARLLVVQTNNATYMGTGQVEQQFAIARLRAIETHRHVAVVATNGVSALVAEDGSVVDRLPTRTTATWESDVPQSSVLTPAVRFARYLDGAVLALALAALVAGWLLARRRGADASASEPAVTVPGVESTT